MHINRVSFRLLVGLLGVASTFVLAALAGDVISGEPTSSKATGVKHLLLDSRIVDQTNNVALAVGSVKKHANNPLFGEDKPWEPRYDNMYPNIIYDEQDGIYKCWYTPFVISELDAITPRDERKSIKWYVSDRRFGLCYATSQDGLEWQKPNLGLIDLGGSKNNNILLFDVHGPDVIKDLRETNPARRYKMFGTMGGLGPHCVWFSPDGLNWSDPIELDLGGRSDTHNNVFWCPKRNEFVAITRFGMNPRTVGRTSSPDFVHWSSVQEVLKPGSGQPDLHDMVALPYEDVYIGLIGVYDVPAGKQWVELAWSPDTVEWHRIQPGTPLIGNSPHDGDYDWGCIFVTRPIVMDDNISIYYAACNGKFFDWRDGFLCLAELTKDRWAGYRNDGSNKGTILTQPLTCLAKHLLLTADAAGGGVEIEVLDSDGNRLAQSEPVCGNVTDTAVQWTSSSDLQSIVGKQVRLRVTVDQATVYSFAFSE